MGYGWMAGLGQAMQQVGSEQIPQYLARRRQEQQDRDAAKQRAVQNALAEREVKLQEEGLGLQRDHMQRVDDLAAEQHFYNTVLPQGVGRHLADLGDGFAAQANKYGVMPNAEGIVQPTWDMAERKRQLDAQIGLMRQQGAAATANAASNQVFRDGQVAGNKMQELARFAAMLDAPESSFTKDLTDRLKDPLVAGQPEAMQAVQQQYEASRARDIQNHLRKLKVMQQQLPPGVVEAYEKLYEEALARAVGGSSGASKPIGWADLGPRP